MTYHHYIRFMTPRMKRIFTFIVILTCYINVACAQFGDIRFGSLTTKDGLSKNWIFNIFQDSRGFMWFCTKDGLNRYDGAKFTTYISNPLDSTTLNSSDIQKICEDRNGDLWVITKSGLNFFDHKTEKFKHFKFD